MDKNSTLNQLILLAYNELDSFDQACIRAEIDQNEALQEEMDEIIEVKQHLDADMRKPSRSSIDIIMRYSRNTDKTSEKELVLS